MKIVNGRKEKVNFKTVIATVDFGKFLNKGYCCTWDGACIKPFDFFNNGRGFELFLKNVLRFKEKQGLEEIVIAFESTGRYTEPFVHYFKKRGIRLVQVNPMHTKRLKEVNDNSPKKTDGKDPRVIADIVMLGHTLTVVVPEGGIADLRWLTKARDRAMKMRTMLLNQIQDFVFAIFPEFLTHLEVNSATGRLLLERYPLPDDMVACGLDVLAKTMRKVSHGKIGYERAQALYDDALRSVGIREARGSIVFEIRNSLALLKTLDGNIEETESRMAEILKGIPCSRYMLSLKGIGPVTASGILGEVANFGAFKTIGELEKLAGLNLYEISSGKHRGERHISKRGRPLLRKFLYLAALNVIRKGGVLREQYQSYLSRGMKKMKAVIAIARKLLGIVFALMRDESLYCKDYQENHSQKGLLKAA